MRVHMVLKIRRESHPHDPPLSLAMFVARKQNVILPFLDLGICSAWQIDTYINILTKVSILILTK